MTDYYPIKYNGVKEPIRSKLPKEPRKTWVQENKIWIISFSILIPLIFLLSLASAGNWVHEEAIHMSCINLKGNMTFPHNNGILENYAESILQDEYNGRCI